MIALAVAPVGAQPVDSFRELAELIEIGRSVVVITSPDGAVITGQLVDILPASLSVFADGRRIELDEARVRRVRQGWNDPIGDGAVLGFAVGVAPWLLAAYADIQVSQPLRAEAVERRTDQLGRPRSKPQRADYTHRSPWTTWTAGMSRWLLNWSSPRSWMNGGVPGIVFV